MASNKRTVAVLGAGSPLGRALVGRLAEDRRIRVVAFDHELPQSLPAGVLTRVLRLADLDAAARLAAFIDTDDIDTVVHLGFLTGRAEAQESQAAEVEQIAKAIAQRPLQRIVFASSTTIYGALPGDPTYSDEETGFATTARSEWVRDKVRAEGRIADLMLETDAAIVTLRFAMVLGPNVRGFITDYLARKAVPVIIDQDPSMQFVHENDVTAALLHAIRQNTPDGPFNIVGEGALPLSVALRSGRRRAAPVPELGSYPLHHALWDPDVVKAPDVLHDLFRYVWVADGTRAQEVLGFQTQISSREAVEDFYKRLG